MDNNNLKNRYQSHIKLLEKLRVTAKYPLSREISRKNIKIHSLEHRIKTFDSFLDKMKRQKTKEPFREIQDLLGLRIVCLFRSDLHSICTIIRDIFNVIEEDNKIDNIAASIFGYMGIHFIVKLKNVSRKDQKSIGDLPFEVQIRTIGQHTWASISEYLYYKQEANVPPHLRRDFHALSGLFHVADAQFEILRKQQLESLLQRQSQA
jgi:ppGpp synthetase/RelA/SpoT-type nucleotidyltranferase